MIGSFVAEHKFILCCFLTSSIHKAGRKLLATKFGCESVFSRQLVVWNTFWAIRTDVCRQYALLHLIIWLLFCFSSSFWLLLTRHFLFLYYAPVHLASWEWYYDKFIADHWPTWQTPAWYFVILTFPSLWPAWTRDRCGYFVIEGAEILIWRCRIVVNLSLSVIWLPCNSIKFARPAYKPVHYVRFSMLPRNGLDLPWHKWSFLDILSRSETYTIVVGVIIIVTKLFLDHVLSWSMLVHNSDLLRHYTRLAALSVRAPMFRRRKFLPWKRRRNRASTFLFTLNHSISVCLRDVLGLFWSMQVLSVMTSALLYSFCSLIRDVYIVLNCAGSPVFVPQNRFTSRIWSTHAFFQ